MRNFVFRLATIAGVLFTLGACADSPTHTAQQRAPDLTVQDAQVQGCVSEGLCVLPPISGGSCEPWMELDWDCDDSGGECEESVGDPTDPEESFGVESCPGGGDTGGGGGWNGGGDGGGDDPGTICIESYTEPCPPGEDDEEEEYTGIVAAPVMGKVATALVPIAGRNHEFKFEGTFWRVNPAVGRSPAWYRIDPAARRLVRIAGGWRRAAASRLVCWGEVRNGPGLKDVGRDGVRAEHRFACGDGTGTSGLLTQEQAVATFGYLDPELLPFTADELFRGLALATGDEQKAREVSHWFAEMLTGGADEGIGWSLPDVVFAAMALVSDDLRQRVDAYMRSGWEAHASVDWSSTHYAAKGFRVAPILRRPPFGRQTRRLRTYVADWERGFAALAEWVRRRQACEPVGDEPPPWPGQEGEREYRARQFPSRRASRGLVPPPEPAVPIFYRTIFRSLQGVSGRISESPLLAGTAGAVLEWLVQGWLDAAIGRR